MRKLGWVRPYVGHPADFYRPGISFRDVLPSTFSQQVESLSGYDDHDTPMSPQIAVASALLFAINRVAGNEVKRPCPVHLRRAMYYSGRSYGEETSVSITDVIRHIQSSGFAFEDEYEVGDPSQLYPVDDESALLALDRTGVEFERVSLSLSVIKMALYEGRSIISGLVAFERIFDGADALEGVIRYEGGFRWPATGTAILLTGWDDSKQSFRCLTPFGPGWGNNGYGWIPYQYFIGTTLTDEHFTVTNVDIRTR